MHRLSTEIEIMCRLRKSRCLSQKVFGCAERSQFILFIFEILCKLYILHLISCWRESHCAICLLN